MVNLIIPNVYLFATSYAVERIQIENQTLPNIKYKVMFKWFAVY